MNDKYADWISREVKMLTNRSVYVDPFVPIASMLQNKYVE